ncbi:hypothetical protein [Lysinibacillus sphaericus]|uniref:Uncharacterized protein n=1 Tax=Lysinibacillus sphaericus OT4b.31 TaxID=1285586 RepID=R7ZB34_LYSSH|nr:hypothetical protein [Lysinibacillus sphaericus]EON71224.1 hypothetical protein H131_17591 [Lysinibacillus sphaericus OT4b.31]
MSELDEQNVGMEHIRQFMIAQLNKLPENSKEKDNSFAFLEKSTLNLLIAYLLSGENRGKSEIVDEEFELWVLKQLDEILDVNKKQFEEIIDFLKKIP